MSCKTSSGRAGGFTLIEVLVTLVITAFGLLGLAGFVVRASTLSADAVQRARAAVLVNDMATRLANNKSEFVKLTKDAAQFSTLRGASSDSKCASYGTVEQQLCEWSNVLAGTNDGGSGAALLGYRGCVVRQADNDQLFIVTVAWGSLTPGAAPADTCGTGEFGNEALGLRRVLRLPVRVATLTAT